MDIANSFWKRILGLMFRKDGEMLFVFEKDVDYSVWTPFMRFPIDIFFMDKDFNVVDVRKNLGPWKIYKPSGKYRYFFESRKGRYSNGEISRMSKRALKVRP